VRSTDTEYATHAQLHAGTGCIHTSKRALCSFSKRPTAGELTGTQQRLQQSEQGAGQLQQQLGLLQAKMREGQQALANAVANNVTATSEVEARQAELVALRQAAASEASQQAAELEASRREVAVSQAILGGHQRDVQVCRALHARAHQLAGSNTKEAGGGRERQGVHTRSPPAYPIVQHNAVACLQ
jgi:ribosomal protein L29